MFVLRDENYEFIEYITGDTISTTKDLKKAIISDSIAEAQALKTYINFTDSYLELDIVEIQFKEVTNV